MAKGLGFILGESRYQVIAPVVVARLTNGHTRYIYRNGLLPVEASEKHVEQLLELGMIRLLPGVTE